MEHAVRIDPRWITDDWSSIGRLQSLKLYLDRLTSDEWQFVERFAGSLERLELWLSSSVDLADASNLPFLSTTFPHLTSLRLRAEAAVATHLLPLLSSFPLHAVEIDLFNINEAALEPGRAFFAALEACTPNLRRLSYTHNGGAVLDPTLDARLRRFCHVHHTPPTSSSSTTRNLRTRAASRPATFAARSTRYSSLAWGGWRC